MIERLRVQIPTGAAGEFSSPESALCADSYSVTVPPPCYRRGTKRDPGQSAKIAGGRLHLNHAYTLDPLKSEWADYAAVQAECGNLSGNKLTRNSLGNSW